MVQMKLANCGQSHNLIKHLTVVKRGRSELSNNGRRNCGIIMVLNQILYNHLTLMAHQNLPHHIHMAMGGGRIPERRKVIESLLTGYNPCICENCLVQTKLNGAGLVKSFVSLHFSGEFSTTINRNLGTEINVDG